MKLFFDTETTGKASFKLPHTHPSQPRIVQFAALLTDGTGDEQAMFSCIVKPDGWTIPEEAAAIHGITTEHAEKFGVPMICVLSLFSMFCAQAETLIAHNIDFDEFVTRGEYARMKKEPRIAGMDLFCTMKASTDLCRLPGNFGKFKWPKLTEALKILLGKDLEGAHDALADVRGCRDLYFHLNAARV